MMKVLSPEEGNKLIKDGIEGPKPFMATRFGMTEGQVCWWKGIRGRRLGRTVRQALSWGVGLFPIDDEMIDEFIVAQRGGALMADAIVRWGDKWKEEDELLATFCGTKTPRIPHDSLAAWLRVPDPWTAALADKRVLVIHPFADTIIEQHDNHREEIDILPDFEMEVIEAPMTFGGVGFDGDWADVLESLKDEVSVCDFDVALIACGGYGMPLAGHIRMHGGTAIVLGGMLQLMFGIKGRRWDERPEIAKFYNDAWVYPADHEKPDCFKQVEGGCYWK